MQTTEEKPLHDGNGRQNRNVVRGFQIYVLELECQGKGRIRPTKPTVEIVTKVRSL